MLSSMDTLISRVHMWRNCLARNAFRFITRSRLCDMWTKLCGRSNWNCYDRCNERTKYSTSYCDCVQPKILYSVDVFRFGTRWGSIVVNDFEGRVLSTGNKDRILEMKYVIFRNNFINFDTFCWPALYLLSTMCVTFPKILSNSSPLLTETSSKHTFQEKPSIYFQETVW